MSESLSVFVACFNEHPTLERAIEELLEALAPLGREYEVVIVDDGSTDGSGRLAEELAARHPGIRVVHHGRNLGLGGFYRTSFREARGDLVYFMAADLQPIPAEYFTDFLPLFERGYDGVVGYDLRRQAPALSRLLSLGERVLFALFYPGVPKIGGPLMIRRDLVGAQDLVLARGEDRSWMVLWELMIRSSRDGRRFARVPVRRRPRAKGRSKGSTIGTAVVMLRRLRDLRKALNEGASGGPGR